MKNDAVPAQVMLRVFDSEPATLHFLFGTAKEGVSEIKPISWESFFEQFDLMNLAMVFDDSPTFQILQNDKVPVSRPGTDIS